MRILFCQSVPYLPDEQGGALSSTDALCRRLQARGHEVEVLVKSARRHGWLDRIWNGGPGPSAPFTYSVRRERDPLAAARDICRGRKPDIVVVQLGDLAGLSSVFVQAGIPTIVSIHDVYTFFESQFGPDAQLLKYVACSSFVADVMRKRLNRAPVVMPVVIEPADYRTPTERRVATFVNPVPRKGIEIVFDLAARRPDIKFEIVQSWHLRNRVRTYLVQRAAHHANIRLVPSAFDMRPIYARSRLVLMPSLGDEAWGRVVSEAHVSGIPALASDSGGLPEAVGSGGLIVGRDAPPSEWRSALSVMWDDAAAYERLTKNAVSHASRPEFQPDVVVDLALRIFSEHAALKS